ncbi:MAG: phosphotransferase [Patescibacteria group bacterium]|jgi:thiamine kinase-like enzyme
MARQIQEVGRATYMRRFFTQHMKKFWPGAKKITFFYSKYMRFLSEESYTMKYEIDVLMNNGQVKRKSIRGNRVPKPTYELMKVYYPYFKKNGQHVIARPLYYMDTLGFILYEEYEGWVMREFDRQLPILEKFIPTIAHRLAEIHNRQLRIGQLRTWQDEEAYFRLSEKKIEKFMPLVRRKFSGLKNQYLEGLKNIYDEQGAISIHGDFQASNIIYDLRTGDVGIIDFSSTSRFSPANDVATFMTHLRAMECFISPDSKITHMEKAFLSNYFHFANKQITTKVKNQLPLYQARISLDIITTTAVFTEYNKSPHYRKIIDTMFERATNNLKKII